MPSRIAINTSILLTVLAAGCRAEPYAWRGSAYPDPQPVPSIALVDTSGAPFDLGVPRDQAVLVFFGYTSCPDVCPATTADAAWAVEQLGPSDEEAAFVFITIDPDRDSPAVLRRYLDQFDTRFIGLTGAPADLEAARQAFGVVAEAEPPDDTGAYLFTHTARLFLIDGPGRLVASYPFGTPRADLLADLRHVIEANP